MCHFDLFGVFKLLWVHFEFLKCTRFFKGDNMLEKLLVGIARRDITPEVGCQLFGYRPDLYSDGVNDRLTATAFVFTCGEINALMITVSVCLLDNEVTDFFRCEIEKKYNIPKENILISATHTHTGPSTINMPGWGDIDRVYYEEILKPQVLSAVEEAINSKQEATVGIGVGKSKLGINRRHLNYLNYADLGQSEWGVYNPKMTVISFKNKAGKVFGNIIHYGCHGTVAGLSTKISRDWAGVMTDALEGESGAITAFFNGPEGDVGPRISTGGTTADLSYIYEVGNIGAKDAVNIYNTIKEYKACTISTVSRELTLPYAKRISYEEAKKGCEQFSLESINCDKQMAVYYNKVKDSYENGYIEKENFKLEQNVIRIGEAAFVGFPYELFSEIGLRVNEHIKDLHILSLSNTNGSLGYFPTQDQLCRGGYEIKMFKFNDVQSLVDDADFHLMSETIETINNLER